MPVDPQFGNAVLGEMVRRGNSQEEIQQHLDSLDPAGQETFVNEVAQKYGMSATPSAPAQQPPGALESLAKNATNMLPVAGAAAGGLLALPSAATTGPVGPIAGAALGGGAGQAAKDYINSKFWPSEAPKPGVEELKSVSTGMLGGATQEMGGQVLSSVAAPAIGAAKSIISRIGSAAENSATKIAQRFLGFKPGNVVSAGGRERVADMVSTLQKEGLFKNGPSPEAVQSRVQQIQSQAGQQIGSVYDGPMGDLPVVNVNQLKDEIATELKPGLSRVKEIQPAKLAQLEQVDHMLTRVGQNQETLTGREAWQLQQDIAAKAFEKGVANENLSVYQDTWKVLKNHIDSSLDTLAEPTQSVLPKSSGPMSDLADEFAAKAPQTTSDIPAQVSTLKQANKLYSAATEVNARLESKLTKSDSSSGLRLARRSVAAGVGALAGGTPGAILGTIGEEAVNKYGSQAAIGTLSTGAKILNKIASGSSAFAPQMKEALGKSVAAGAMTHFKLMQTSPDYRKMISKEQDKANNGPQE